MNTVLVHGKVPDAVTEAITKLGHKVEPVTSIPEQAPANDETCFLVVNAPTQLTRKDSLPKDLSKAAENGFRIALTSLDGLTPTALSLIVKAQSTSLILNDGPDGVDKASLDQFLSVTDNPATDRINFADHCTVTTDMAEYHRQRRLCIRMNPAMREFIEGLTEYVREASQVGLPQPIPWNPIGPETNKDALFAEISLRDVLRLHGSDGARELLHPRDAAGSEITEWAAPSLLLLGESGTGKTMVARMIADMIARELGATLFPFVPVNCPGLEGDQFTHVMHGTAQTEYTDVGTVVGRLAEASYGVVFLDEVGDLPAATQAGLLTYLEDNLVQPRGIQSFLGFTRVIAATNRDVDHLVATGRYRNDLIARFKKRLKVPSLAERSEEERRHLVLYAAVNPSANWGLSVKQITVGALQNLSSRTYVNGNYRELEATVHHAITAARRRNSGCITLEDLPEQAARLTVPEGDLRVIPVQDFPDPAHPILEVQSVEGIRRIADQRNAFIWRTPDGVEYVDVDGHTLCYVPGGTGTEGAAVRAESDTRSDLRYWFADGWGKALVADDSGPALGDVTLNYRLHPIASNLDGTMLAAAASDGSVRVFPRTAFDAKPVLQVPAGSECLCLGATNNLVVRQAGRLATYHFDAAQDEWDAHPDFAWPQVDADTVLRAFLIPDRDREELALLFQDGTLNETAANLLSPLRGRTLRDLDLLRQQDGLWVAAIADEMPVAKALTVHRLNGGWKDPLPFEHPLLYDSDTIAQAMWARGSEVDPLLVVILGEPAARNLGRRIRSATGSWKAVSA